MGLRFEIQVRLVNRVVVASVVVGVCFSLIAPSCLPQESSDTAASAYVESPITESDRNHWSLKPRHQVDVPEIVNTPWLRNPVDAFVAAALERQDLTPQPSSSRSTLIRRVCLDLTGILPSSTEVAAFVADDSADAYARLIDRLLESPAYGERWAQHWLDLARFAETDGFEHDLVRPNAWRYRDWVIDAFNADLPYDEFIRLQIAGDLLEPDNPAAAIATQFCVSGSDMPDINSQEERRHTLLNEMTSTVGEVILGLQIGCAQCHDHKYDPVSQADFYRIRAVFEPAIRLKKNASVEQLTESAPYEFASHVMIRGDFRRTGPEVQPGVLRVLQSDSLTYTPAPIRNSDGRRAAFARWLTDPNHPLTARVIVNRVWQHHFGTGICESSSDFGIMGLEPSNPQLLDWLAGWFVDNAWSIKKLHRLIVTSATYRQHSRLPENATAAEVAEWRSAYIKDPDARLLSRYPGQRLEGEVIRDAMLQIAGILNRKTGGPGIRPPLPAELRGALLKDQWEVTADESEHHRRSIYVFARRNLRFPIFESFDRPAANESCSRRSVSTTAPQALHLLNSEFSLNMANLTAKRICEQNSDRDQQVSRVFEEILGRAPSVDELADVTKFLASSEEDGMTHLCLSLMNCNEFVWVD